MDAFNQFTQWYRWQDILSLAHLIVACRPPYTQPKSLASSLQQRVITQPELLLTKAAGSIYFANTTPLAIASSAIREQCRMGLSPQYLVPDKVVAYIQQQGIYSGQTV